MRALRIGSDDWEVLYVDGVEIEQGHHLGEGNGFTFLLRMGEKYKFTYDEFNDGYVNDKGAEYLEEHGSFPNKLTDFKGCYDVYTK